MKITVAGYYGAGNLGDELILKGMIRALRLIEPNATVTAISQNPGQTRLEHGIEAVNFRNLQALEDVIRKSDMVVIGGGGIFHDYWGVDRDTLATYRHHGLTYYATVAMMTTRYKRPLHIWGVGLGPLNTDDGKEITRFILETARSIIVRDPLSLNLIENLYPKTIERAQIAPDFSILALESLYPEVRPLNQNALSRSLGINLRFWMTPGMRKLPISPLRNLIKGILEFQPWEQIILFPFQAGTRFLENDPGWMNYVLKPVLKPWRSKILVCPVSASWTTRLQNLQKCSMFLGMRLHSIITASLFVKHLMALVYDPKVDAVCRMLDIPTMLFPFESLSMTETPGQRLSSLTEFSEHQKTRSGMDIGVLSHHANRTLDAIKRALLYLPPEEQTVLPIISANQQGTPRRRGLKFKSLLRSVLFGMYQKLPYGLQLWIYLKTPDKWISRARRLYHSHQG